MVRLLKILLFGVLMTGVLGCGEKKTTSGKDATLPSDAPKKAPAPPPIKMPDGSAPPGAK
jgi:hypothetical protein